MPPGINNSVQQPSFNFEVIPQEDIHEAQNQRNSMPASSANREPGANPLNANGPEANDPGVDHILNHPSHSIHEPNNQASNFVAQHQVQSGKDWDLSRAKEMLGLVQESVAHIKETVSGGAIGKFTGEVSAVLNRAITEHPGQDYQPLVNDLKDLLQAAGELKAARSELVKGITDGSDIQDPEAALSAVRTGLRQFRYQTQKAVIAMNPGGNIVQTMGVAEGAMRGIQNLFSGTVVTKAMLEQIVQLEDRLASKVADIQNKLQAIDPNLSCPQLPDNFRLLSTIGDTLELSHRTNDQIRGFQDKRATESALRTVLTPVCKRGGSHKVTLSGNAGQLIGLGFPATVVAGLRVGLNVQITADVSAPGGNKPIDVTYRLTGGLEGKLVGAAELLSTDESSAGGGGNVTKFVTRSYATLDDLILDADRCWLATSRSLAGALLGKVGSAIGNLGTKVFRLIGRHSGDVMQNNHDYLESMKMRGLVSSLDTVLAKRANPVIVAERRGLTGQLSGAISAKIGFGGGFGAIAGEVSGEYQRDFSVSSRTYAPIVQNIRNASRQQLMDMRRPLPDGVTMIRISDQISAEELTEKFNSVVQNCKDNPPKDLNAWADFANRVRSALIMVELQYLNGSIGREEADRLLERFSNPEIKMPPDIYREYLMENTGNAKPAKIRSSFSGSAEISTFLTTTKGWTEKAKSISNPLLKAAADTGISEFRSLSGADTTVKYSFSSEKPAHPDADPRPWENTVKTTHQITVTSSMPFRAITDFTTRLYLKKGERADVPTQHSIGSITGDIAKDIPDNASQHVLAAIPKMMVACARESSKAAVIKLFSDPEKAQNLAKFIIDNSDESYEIIVKTVEWAAEHPDQELNAALTAGSNIVANSLEASASAQKTIKWDFVDGEPSLFSVYQEDTSKYGISSDPFGKDYGTSVSITYSVTDSLKERGMLLGTSLTALMGHAEAFMLAKTDVTAHSTNNQSLKNYLSSNLSAVKGVLADLESPKNVNLYLKALYAARGDLDLQIKIQDARQRLVALPADAPDYQVVDAAHDFILAMTMGYRSSFDQA